MSDISYLPKTGNERLLLDCITIVLEIASSIRPLPGGIQARARELLDRLSETTEDAASPA